MGCYGKMEGLNWLLEVELLLLLLLLWRLLVAVCEMAEFVCHTPDHNQGIKVGWVVGRGRREVGKEKKQPSKSIKRCCCICPSHQTWLASPVQV